MRVHEALRLCLPLLQRLRDNGVRMEDIDYIPMYEEYLEMRDRTMEEVLSIYKETGVLVIDGRGKSSINTRIGQ